MVGDLYHALIRKNVMRSRGTKKQTASRGGGLIQSTKAIGNNKNRFHQPCVTTPTTRKKKRNKNINNNKYYESKNDTEILLLLILLLLLLLLHHPQSSLFSTALHPLSVHSALWSIGRHRSKLLTSKAQHNSMDEIAVFPCKRTN